MNLFFVFTNFITYKVAPNGYSCCGQTRHLFVLNIESKCYFISYLSSDYTEMTLAAVFVLWCEGSHQSVQNSFYMFTCGTLLRILQVNHLQNPVLSNLFWRVVLMKKSGSHPMVKRNSMQYYYTNIGVFCFSLYNIQTWLLKKRLVKYFGK